MLVDNIPKRNYYTHMFKLILKLKERGFLLSELVKRDFKKKYKRTYLGVLWSLLSPLLSLLIMTLIFKNFFGRSQPHYTTYIFCGNIVFSFFTDSTSGGMASLVGNADIFSKINLPKYLFLFSKNISSLINFGLTLVVFFLFCIIDKITFGWVFFALIIPIFCLVIFNLGVGLILSALFVFFRDMQYLWGVFTTLLMYMSAIFYTVDNFSEKIQLLFNFNPVYVYIRYFRLVVIDGRFPSPEFNILALAYAVLSFAVGALIYKKYNHKFIYYV